MKKSLTPKKVAFLGLSIALAMILSLWKARFRYSRPFPA